MLKSDDVIKRAPKNDVSTGSITQRMPAWGAILEDVTTGHKSLPRRRQQGFVRGRGFLKQSRGVRIRV